MLFFEDAHPLDGTSLNGKNLPDHRELAGSRYSL